jgi:phosphoribosylformylglycinamidine cyclo-ligase
MLDQSKPPASYAQAGVDIEKGDRFVELIKSIKSAAIPSTLGGFSGAISLEPNRFKQPVMLTTTDGVGTKILVAAKLDDFSTIGIDLVAMCVNDLIVCGAEPLVFLDYIACGSLNLDVMRTVMEGIVKGCEQAGCTLGGGETAEMPDMYGQGDFDLAGFAVGMAEKALLLPRKKQIKAGDIILGLPSTGIHSNGLSLARKLAPQNDLSFWKELLKPTKIYVADMKALLKTGAVLAAAHITGGGISGNLQRVIPGDLVPVLNHEWPVPDIFSRLQSLGGVTDAEMFRVFNMGIGLALVTAEEHADGLLNTARSLNIPILVAGRLARG